MTESIFAKAPPFHFWDFTDAPVASVATVKSKTRKGWKLLPVSQRFGTVGGTADYRHALVGPAGELAKVSMRSVSAAGVDAEMGTLRLSMQVVLFRERIYKSDLVREATRRGLARMEQLKVRWNPELFRWMVRPEDAADFPHFISAGAEPVHMFPSLTLESACT